MRVHAHVHAHTYTHTHIVQWVGEERGVRVCPQDGGWAYPIYLLPLASVIHANTLAAEIGWISWIQGDCSKINKMKQCNLEFVGNM